MSASTPAVKLIQRATEFLSAIKNPCAAESSNGLLHALLNQILADEIYLYINLAYLTAAPFLTTYGEANETCIRTVKLGREPTNTVVDGQA